MALEWRKVRKDLLEPLFLRDVEELLSESKWGWYVTHGFRDSVEQNKLYGQGRDHIQLAKCGLQKYARPDLPLVTKAKAWQSAHNYGLAIDVVLDGDDRTPGLQPVWDVNLPAWIWLKAAIYKHPRLRGGYRWGDWPHIERLNWSQHTNWRSSYYHA